MTAHPDFHKRHIKYLDQSIQKWLLISMVAMEAILGMIALWLLYTGFGEAIDQNLYRIHQSDNTSVFSQLLTQGLKVLGYIVLVNFAALFIADRIWAFYVNGILRSLMALMTASRKLDLSEKPEIRCNHDVLAQALAWRRGEFDRAEQLRKSIRNLPSSLPASEEGRAAIRADLNKIRDELADRPEL